MSICRKCGEVRYGMTSARVCIKCIQSLHDYTVFGACKVRCDGPIKYGDPVKCVVSVIDNSEGFKTTLSEEALCSFSFDESKYYGESAIKPLGGPAPIIRGVDKNGNFIADLGESWMVSPFITPAYEYWKSIPLAILSKPKPFNSEGF